MSRGTAGLSLCCHELVVVEGQVVLGAVVQAISRLPGRPEELPTRRAETGKPVARLVADPAPLAAMVSTKCLAEIPTKVVRSPGEDLLEPRQCLGLGWPRLPVDVRGFL